jgi:leucyl aminopeptidase
MYNNVNINLVTQVTTSDEIVISFLHAPKQAGIDTLGRDVGDVWVNLADRKAVVSLGEKEAYSIEVIRRVGGLLMRWLVKNHVNKVVIDLDSLPVQNWAVTASFHALTEGLVLGSYRFNFYKSEPDLSDNLDINLLTFLNPIELRDEIEKAKLVSEATNLARDLTNEPPNVLDPSTLTERIVSLAKDANLKVRIIDEAQLSELGADAIISVGKGALAKARLVVLEHQSDAISQSSPVALIGKAITYDTGGYSGKSSAGMIGMKYDKAGGMVVVATLVAAARARLNIPLVGVIAIAENMVSDSAYRPDDIIRTMSGKTVEIINTDAEGRLILADALTYTQRFLKPRIIVDVATLTGGVIVALGNVRAGLMSNDEALSVQLLNAGEQTTERLWQLPLDSEYFYLIRGEAGDLKNSGGRDAQAIAAGLFLKQFVSDEIPWAHLDIDGVAKTNKDLPYCSVGSTGFGVRLLFNFLSKLA